MLSESPGPLSELKRGRMHPNAFDDVLTAAQAGAAWAFERLYNDLAPGVAGYLRSQGALDPEDLTSEVFIGVFKGLGGFVGGEEKFRSWVFTIAHRRLTDDRRRRGRRPTSEPLSGREEVRNGGDVEAEALASLGDERVRSLLGMLSPDQRAVLALRIIGDLTVEQVAEAIGKRPGAVKALQRRALAALRKVLAEQEAAL
jgi:RNA polymerase sigma factor (sigma-70 family)